MTFSHAGKAAKLTSGFSRCSSFRSPQDYFHKMIRRAASRGMKHGPPRCEPLSGPDLCPLISASMWTALRVQALVGNAQPFDRPAANQVLCDDLGRVFGPHAAIPDGLRVDHHRGPMLALVQAAGFVNAYSSSETSFFCQLLQTSVQVAFSIGRAGRSGCIGGAGIMTDKNVVLEYGQTGLLCYLFRIADAGLRLG
jgi:hypothetical protein